MGFPLGNACHRVCSSSSHVPAVCGSVWVGGRGGAGWRLHVDGEAKVQECVVGELA